MGEREFTIAIGSFNRCDSLCRAIEHLFAQDEDNPFDLVVVLDGSTDGSAEAVRKRFATAPEHISTTLIEHQTNLGVGAVHNSSLRVARTPFIIFIDDDCVADPDFLSRYRVRWSSAPDSVIAIGGFISSFETNTLNRQYLDALAPHRPIEREYLQELSLWQRVFLYFSPPQHRGFRPVYDLVGGNMSFRTEKLRSSGGFDEAVRLGGFERRACARIQAEHGLESVWADPNIVIAHDFHPAISETFARACRVGQAMGRDFVWAKKLPSLRLGSIATSLATLGAIALCGWWGILALVLVPLLVFRTLLLGSSNYRWIFPFIALIEETMKNCGFLIGVWIFRAEWRRAFHA